MLKRQSVHQSLLTSPLPELTTKPTTPMYIHTKDVISLVCTLKVKAQAEIKTVKFFKDKVEQGSAVATSGTESKTITFAKSEAAVVKTDGGTYSCVYEFNVGDPISASTVVAIHSELSMMLTGYLFQGLYV